MRNTELRLVKPDIAIGGDEVEVARQRGIRVQSSSSRGGVATMFRPFVCSVTCRLGGVYVLGGMPSEGLDIIRLGGVEVLPPGPQGLDDR